MKKVKVLLSAVAVVAVVAGAFASNARVPHTIYTPNALTPTICDVAVTARAFAANPNATQFATLAPGAACVKGVITVLDKN